MLVQGASGGVATALIVLGRAAGYRIWVTGRSEEKRAAALALGADQAFESGARLPERVDGVMETVGEATWSHSIKSLKPGGVHRHLRRDDRLQPRRRAQPGLLHPAVGDRLDHGHPRRSSSR